ncbi:disease resistance protein RGA2-like [Sorghum bicolor]|uniref:disease resistance protein RGA2-like n=1 Tax=Sorghum bicolor TaxID=4558 RepID=UPI000B423AD4|nr:disease resistance protein RGA2-like [Sorghum bicolor]|eukprot:XP_021317622.1 disease resistance protein RGA2-like [Sorghum bicolor]
MTLLLKALPGILHVPLGNMEVVLVSGPLKVIGNKLAALITSKFASVMGVRKDLHELQQLLTEITRWFSRFEDKAIENDPSFCWTTKLKDLAYDIEDLLDEVHLEAEKHKIDIDADNHSTADCFCAKPMLFLFRCKVASKIKGIKVRFAAIVKQRSDINTVLDNSGVDPSVRSRPITGELSFISKVEEFSIPVRDKKKDDIISSLIDSDEGLNGWIVSIIGIGGSGKTTLAKLICLDKRTKEHFKDSILWVHVSQEFDLEKLIGKLFESIAKKKADRHTQQYMVNAISNRLSGKKFLLVLDDAWHDDRDDWKQFLVHIRSGAHGSRVLLTTRDQKVAEAVGSIGFVTLPDSIGKLMKLRTLELLQSTDLESLPESIGDCQNLQYLLLYLCEKLRELPNSVGKIESLRVLQVVKCHIVDTIELSGDLGRLQTINLAELPNWVTLNHNLESIDLRFGKLTCLRKLGLFVVGAGVDDARILELGNLKMISGRLEITNLQYLRNPSDAKNACLKQKNIEFLMLNWSQNQMEEASVSDMEHDLLQQSPNLKHMRGLVQLPLLKKLRLCRMPNLEELQIITCASDVTEEERLSLKNSNYELLLSPECSSSHLLSHLKDLRLEGMAASMSGWELLHHLTGLESLEICLCNDLTQLPETIRSLRSLKRLEVKQCSNLVKFPEWLGQLSCLQQLLVLETPLMASLPQSTRQLTCLVRLHIGGWHNLKQLPEVIQHLTSLHTLRLEECSAMAVLPEWIGELSALRRLILERCTALESLPRSIQRRNRLQYLSIAGCPHLAGYKKQVGDEWHLLPIFLR